MRSCLRGEVPRGSLAFPEPEYVVERISFAHNDAGGCLPETRAGCRSCCVITRDEVEVTETKSTTDGARINRLVVTPEIIIAEESYSSIDCGGAL